MIENPAEHARFNMTHQQIRPWNVNDVRVLDAIIAVPREAFVPEAYRGVAFVDAELPLPNGRSMPSPKIEAKMLQALAIQPEDNILVVGTGSGYLTACLAKLGGKVTSIDSDADSVEAATARLDELGIGNASLSVAAPMETLPKGPYDAVVITASLPQRDDRFEKILKVGGRLFVVIGQAPAMEACLISRIGDDEWRCDSLFETELEPLDGTAQPESFDF